MPQSNTVLTGTTALVQDIRTYQTQYAQNWVFGLNAQVSYSSQHIKVNSQFFTLNPYTSGNLDLQITQNLLQGFGSAVNGRNIRVQKNNLKVTDLQFKLQVITTVSAVLNLYWDLVSFLEDVRAREQEVKTAQQLFDDNKKQVKIGSLAEIEVTRAESQLYAARQDLIISQTNLAAAGDGTEECAEPRRAWPLPTWPRSTSCRSIKIVIPAQDEIRPVDDLVADAVKNRVEIAAKPHQPRKQSTEPGGHQEFPEAHVAGLCGTDQQRLDRRPHARLEPSQPGVGYLAGGYGNLLAQIARRNFPNYSAGFSLNIPLRNRAAQSDYVTSLIEIRQNELSLQKSVNQVRVDVQNAVIGLQQARARYDAAVQARILAQQTLDADQKQIQPGGGDTVSGGAGSARPGQRPEL